MGTASIYILGTQLHQSLGTLAERTGSINHIINHDAGLALYIANQVHNLGTARARTTLLNDRNAGAQKVSHIAGTGNTAQVRGYHNHILQVQALEILSQGRSSSQMIHRDIKEALNLACMQVNGHHAVQACSRHEVCHQLGRDRLTAAGLAVLASVCIIRHNCSHALGRCALAGICHNQQLHQVLVDRLTGWLNNKDVFSTNTFTNHDLNLTIVKMAHLSINQRNSEMFRNFLCQLRICVAGQKS